MQQTTDLKATLHWRGILWSLHEYGNLKHFVLHATERTSHNSLLPTVQKAHSKAQGVLSLVPLPKIDELYARLKGSSVYSTLDCMQGYHHIGLSEEAQRKSAFVTPLGKFEYHKTPFGLAQAPAYFQALMNQILHGLDF